jgi:anti-sigma factor RsiW
MENKSDIKGYFLGETSRSERAEIENALAADPVLRHELEEWETLGIAMKSLREEEPTRRIAFVSDKVIAPSAWQTFWKTWFSGWPQVAMASSLALSFAVLGHGWISRPVATTASTAQTTAAPAISNKTNPSEGAIVSGNANREVQQLKEQIALLRAELQQDKKQGSMVAASTSERSVDLRLAAMEQRLSNRQREDMDAVGQQIGLIRRDLGNSFRAQNQEARLERPTDLEGRQ